MIRVIRFLFFQLSSEDNVFLFFSAFRLKNTILQQVFDVRIFFGVFFFNFYKIAFTSKILQNTSKKFFNFVNTHEFFFCISKKKNLVQKKQ